MLIPASLLSPTDNLHEMEKLYVTRVTSARSWPLAMSARNRSRYPLCPKADNSGALGLSAKCQ